jgi:CheY-like chemotaxis protein
MQVATSKNPGKGPVALIVDDDQNIRVLLRGFLHGVGFSCIAVESGEDAIDVAHSTPLSVVFLDLNLPGIKGLEVAKRIRASEANAKTPIAVITVDDQLGTMSRAFSAGASAFIQKPITRKAVASLLTALGFASKPASYSKAG